MKVIDRRTAYRDKELDPVISGLKQKIESEVLDDVRLEIRDDSTYFPYTNGAYLYADYYPVDENELNKWLNENWWCHLYVKPDEDNPGYCQFFVLDPQQVCQHMLAALFYGGHDL